MFAALAEKERALISERTKKGLAVAKQRGQRLGGWTAGSEEAQRKADEFAERMRPVLAELASLSATAAAAELNARKIATAAGGKWYPATVIRLRERLNNGEALKPTGISIAVAVLLAGCVSAPPPAPAASPPPPEPKKVWSRREHGPTRNFAHASALHHVRRDKDQGARASGTTAYTRSQMPGDARPRVGSWFRKNRDAEERAPRAGERGRVTWTRTSSAYWTGAAACEGNREPQHPSRWERPAIED